MADAAESDTTLSHQPVQLCDVSNLTRYLRRAVPSLLDDNEDGDSAAENAFAKCLNDRVSQENIRKFIADPQTPALLIQKEIQKGTVLCGDVAMVSKLTSMIMSFCR